MRTLFVYILCAALCTGCGGAGGSLDPASRDASGFELTVLPASYAPGGSAAALAATPRLTRRGVEVEIRGRVRDLRAFYFELAYDAQRWHPLSVEQNLGADAETIQLAVTDRPGRVHAGRVLVQPERRAGVSGELLLATVRFAPGADAAGRAVSQPPDHDTSAALLVIDEAGMLSWHYDSTGDYDQNSQVNIADLTPIAANYLENTAGAGAFPYDTLESVVDGDSNGEINISDLTPIGANLQNTCAAYRVYRSQNAADYPGGNLEAPKVAHFAEVPFSAAQGQPNQVRLGFTLDVSAEGGLDTANFFWVRPIDGAAADGTPSNMVTPPTPGNAAPNITGFSADVNPVLAGADVNLSVTATDADGDPLSYSYSATAGTVDDTGTNTTVFHAPVVAVQTNVTVTVTVDDGQGHTPTRDLVIVVDPIPVTEVHIEFSPAAEGGSGTLGDAYGLLGEADYTFTATDQNGTDITSLVTFSFINDPPGGDFPQGSFNGNVFSTNIVGSGTFAVLGTYDFGGPGELPSDPDAAGEEMHFTIVFTLP